jgi:putative endonuclease
MSKFSESQFSGSPSPGSPHPEPGVLGEQLVARWWRSQGALVLHQRWHCRWGELDLIVGQPQSGAPNQPRSLAFVEVKTRSSGNWDADGALAMTHAKQKKLWKTAQVFLSQRPDWSELPCQFDVALVYCRALPRGVSISPRPAPSDRYSQIASGYRLTLQDYIPNAFSL